MRTDRVSTSSDERTTSISDGPAILTVGAQVRSGDGQRRGEREVRQPIPLSVPELSGNEWKYLKACLDTGWVSSAGPFVDRFERAVAAYVGAAYGVAVVNGTAGLHTALQVIGLRPNDEVLVPDLTFVAPVNAVRYCRAHPILVDVNPQTWQMDVDKLAWFLRSQCVLRARACYNRRTGRRLRAIVPVHILGLACDMDRIVELAHQYSLQVVEDAAEALGVRVQGRHVGTFGDIGVLSFNGNKIMTSGGGGMLVTNHPRYAERARYLTTQAKDDDIEYVHREVGYNYRLTSLQAAVGLAQLERLDEFIERKRHTARVYEEALRGVDGLTTMPTPPGMEPTFWLYTVLLAPNVTLERRRSVIARLNEHGIGARPFWCPIHRLRPYQECQTVKLAHSFRLYKRGVSLPSSVALRADDRERCISVLKQVLQK